MRSARSNFQIKMSLKLEDTSRGFCGSVLVQTILKLLVGKTMQGIIFEHLKEDIALIRKEKTNRGH